MWIINLFKKQKSVFTFSERLHIYRLAKHIYIDDCNKNNIENYSGMCWAIDYAMFSLYKRFDRITSKNFPELYKRKPLLSKIEGYWWPVVDKQIRIDTFDKIIVEMQNKLIKPKWYQKFK